MNLEITEEFTGRNFDALVNLKKGTVDRRIFFDRAIYQAELERIFARAWNFVCHESQISAPGEYFLSFIGNDSVIATRDMEGNVQVLLNTCRHRGNSVCRAERGRTRSFTCPYHGWSYDLTGKLVGVPGYQAYYHEDLKREDWGLVRAAKVESYKGFVFATLDPVAPPLADYLGPVGRLGLSMVSAHGDIAVVEGIQKYRIKCNWKLAVDNLFDWYHPPMTHASALSSGYAGKVAWSPSEHIVALGEYGHAIGGPRISRAARDDVAEQIRAGDFQLQDEAWRNSPRAATEIGEFGAQQRGHPGIFPNLWIASNATQLCLRLPKAPDCTEIWWFTLLDKNLPADERAACINRSNHFFGPAGMFEQDDGENWDQGTRASSGTIGRRYPMNFAMNLGRGHVKHDASGIAYVESDVNEHAQLWTYRAWAEWMTADSWSALKRHHSIPDDTV